MIDPAFKDKDVEFEISIGSYGNLIDGGVTAQSLAQMEDTEDLDADDETLKLLKTSQKEEANLPIHSTSSSFRPQANDNEKHYHIDFGRDKPCLFVVGMFENVTRRLYMSNALDRIVENLVSIV